MTAWDEARAWSCIDSMVEAINAAWKPGAVHDAKRAIMLEELLVLAINKQDLGRVELLCQRYKEAVIRDIKKDQQSLF